MSCYLPMIEKLKSAATGKNRSNEIDKNKKSIKNVSTKPFEDSYNTISRYSHDGYDSEPPPYDSIHSDEPYTELEIGARNRGPLPRRDQAGFTITQNIGEFPNRVPLNIRYDHPRLALSDVAFQRQHQLHHHNVQRQSSQSSSPMPIQKQQQQQQHQHQNQHQQHQHHHYNNVQQMQQANQITVLPYQHQHHVIQNMHHYQNQQQLQTQHRPPLPNHHHQQQQLRHTVIGSPMNSRGVLSLGLPPQLMPNSIFRRTPKPTADQSPSRPPPSATSDVIHHTYETLNLRRFFNNSDDSRSRNVNNNNLTMLPPAQARTRTRGSSLPRRAKKIPSSSYSQILAMRPKSVQDDLILNDDDRHPDPYHVTPLTSLERQDDLDSSLKTTDSGQSSGSSTVGSQSPKSHVDSDVITSVEINSTLAPHPSPRRQSAFTSLPNRGPPPRHLIPATLRPSPGVKLHPADILQSLREADILHSLREQHEKGRR